MTGASRGFVAGMLAIVLLGLALRTAFPAADPPWRTTVGIVWHDEGAWVHNARNKALFGAWRLDEWNPVFIAPVFTGLEYASFAAFGVGVRQARLVSEAAGLASVVLLALAVRRIGGDVAGLVAGGLLATNYVYVMYDRAAIMEALMAAFIVASWYCSTRAEDGRGWAAAAGAAATLAYFTKAAAAFYIVAIALASVSSLWRPRPEAEAGERRAAAWTLLGLAASGALALALFVAPHWSEYRFYNWQMSVSRKPSYDLASILVRVSWFPILHDTFSRMWFSVVVGLVAGCGVLIRWSRALAAERLLVLWIGVGVAELLVHDVGNERRFVFLIPALIALTALALGRDRRLLPPEATNVHRRAWWIAAPLVIYLAYITCGPIARLPFLYVVRSSVRIDAALAAALTVAFYARRERLLRLLSSGGWPAAMAGVLTVALMGGDLVQFAQWAAGRSYKNYDASVTLGRVLPADTLVQGKLANGLSLENRIRPVFIGHEFGNYADRKRRDDVRYILTYISPWTGFEGSQITDVLDAYPRRRIIMTFDVAETSSGHDRAALIDKFGGAPPPPAGTLRGTAR